MARYALKKGGENMKKLLAILREIAAGMIAQHAAQYTC